MTDEPQQPTEPEPQRPDPGKPGTWKDEPIAQRPDPGKPLTKGGHLKGVERLSDVLRRLRD
jgi:hypothetical protein